MGLWAAQTTDQTFHVVVYYFIVCVLHSDMSL